jgi:hypothetical protein
MIMMAVVSPLVALHFNSVYMIIPPLMLFGLSSPVTLTPILPEMGEIVSDMVRNTDTLLTIQLTLCFIM